MSGVESMPVISAAVMEIRLQLREQGIKSRVVYAKEGREVYGVLPREENAFPIPANYAPMWTAPVKERK
jgi:hypothetical protein